MSYLLARLLVIVLCCVVLWLALVCLFRAHVLLLLATSTFKIIFLHFRHTDMGRKVLALCKKML